MQDIRVLVADDEIPARGELKYELATIPGVQIVGECKNGKEVLDFLNVHPNVDILFLDIEMPFMNGLECAKEIQRRDYPVKIVFATGYSQFAVQAFDLEAFDYILKPYDEKRIQRTIKRYADSLELRENHRSPGEIINTSQRISLQTKDKTVMISPAQEIIIISTEKSDRSLFYTTSGIIESRMALRDAEQLLAYGLRDFAAHESRADSLQYQQIRAAPLVRLSRAGLHSRGGMCGDKHIFLRCDENGEQVVFADF